MSPDRRQHRGAHPEDRKLFAPERLSALRAATAELSWLLERGYPERAALKLVGDRHRLAERQRTAVSRAACPAFRLERRRAARIAPAALRGQRLVVDGFNLLITVEAALGGGPLLRCRDGCLRDLSGVHGSYRSVQETEPALRLVGAGLAALAPESVHWLLDRPVSNSGRLAARIRALAEAEGWAWSVEPVFNPDRLLIAAPEPVATSDSVVLDGAARWIDLGLTLLAPRAASLWILDLADDPSRPLI